MRRALFAIGSILVFALQSPLFSQSGAPLAKAYEDDVFKIWYMHWRPGTGLTMPYRHEGATVVVFLEDGTLRLPSGVTQSRKEGDVVYFEPGSFASAGELVSNARVRALIVELKNSQAPPQPTDVPSAFPRSNTSLVLANKDVVVWNVQYRPEQPSPVMGYRKNTVQVWLTAATIDRANEQPRQATRPRGAFEVLHAGFVTSERVLDTPAMVVAIERK